MHSRRRISRTCECQNATTKAFQLNHTHKRVVLLTKKQWRDLWARILIDSRSSPTAHTHTDRITMRPHYRRERERESLWRLRGILITFSACCCFSDALGHNNKRSGDHKRMKKMQITSVKLLIEYGWGRSIVIYCFSLSSFQIHGF